MKNKLKVGDVARKLNIKKNVIRFWEKEFNFRSEKNKNEKYYTHEEFNTFATIKKMVHDKGIPISEVKTKLQSILPAEKTSPLKESNEKTSISKESQVSPSKEVVKKNPPKQAPTEVKQSLQQKVKIKSPVKTTPKVTVKTETQKPTTKMKPQKEVTIQVKEIEKVVEIEKPLPYIPQEFLDQLHLLKEQLIKFKNLLN